MEEASSQNSPQNQNRSGSMNTENPNQQTTIFGSTQGVEHLISPAASSFSNASNNDLTLESFSNKRKLFMTEMRRQTRMNIIKQKRSLPCESFNKNQQLNLDHLKEYENKEELIPKIKEYLQINPTVDDLLEIKNLLQKTPENT